MDIGSELFSMAFALKLQRVAHPTVEASSLRLSDASTVDNNFYLGSDNIKVISENLISNDWAIEKHSLFAYRKCSSSSCFSCRNIKKNRNQQAKKALQDVYMEGLGVFLITVFCLGYKRDCEEQKISTNV